MEKETNLVFSFKILSISSIVRRGDREVEEELSVVGEGKLRRAGEWERGNGEECTAIFGGV